MIEKICLMYILSAQKKKRKTWLAVLYFFLICLSIGFSFHYLLIFYFNPLNCIRYFLIRKWERRRNITMILFKCCEKYKNWLTFLAATTWSQYMAELQSSFIFNRDLTSTIWMGFEGLKSAGRLMHNKCNATESSCKLCKRQGTLMIWTEHFQKSYFMKLQLRGDWGRIPEPLRVDFCDHDNLPS